MGSILPSESAIFGDCFGGMTASTEGLNVELVIEQALVSTMRHDVVELSPCNDDSFLSTLTVIGL